MNSECRDAHTFDAYCSGLQFTLEMQESSIKSLSGGWRMRVALAAALLIEPDLLMLGK